MPHRPEWTCITKQTPTGTDVLKKKFALHFLIEKPFPFMKKRRNNTTTRMIKKLLAVPVLCAAITAYTTPRADDPQAAAHSSYTKGFADSVAAALQKIKFKDGQGRVVALPELKGKVVVLNYWAPWCPPCVREMPSFYKLRKHFADHDDLVFLMVAVDNEYAKAKAFMDRHGYNLPVYTSEGPILNELYEGALPTTAIFNRANKLADIYIETNDFSVPDFVEKLKGLLEE